MKRYDSYKDSGVEWIGEIPSHWESKQLKRLAKIGNGKDYKDIEVEIDGYPVYGTGGEFSRCSAYLHTGPSVLLGRKGTINNPLFVNEPFWTSDTIYYTIIDETKIIPSLLFRLVHQIPFDLYTYGSAIPSMNKSDYEVMKFPTPPLSEQKQIVSFLDTKTALIDSLIEKTQRKIELLKEKRTALINEVVTKGLNPHVEMKDSGVEWIGEIPSHWDKRKLAWSFNDIGSGTTPKSSNTDYYNNGTINWLLTGDLNDGYIYNTSKKITELALENHSLKLYPKKSIVIAMYGATIGRLGILETETTTNQACCVLAESDIFHHKYVFYWLKASKQEIINLSYGGGQPNISQDIIRNLWLTFPPLSEQKQIVAYLDEQTGLIDKTISIEEKRIELLEAYRQSLISEVVTGKRKVVA
ncbi:restriction endonuclease subunit S [Crocinitomicaceae bacterium]|nr:restriction endonuclease subunit S [Crocinitomicaceae bacterium]